MLPDIALWLSLCTSYLSIQTINYFGTNSSFQCTCIPFSQHGLLPLANFSALNLYQLILAKVNKNDSVNIPQVLCFHGFSKNRERIGAEPKLIFISFPIFLPHPFSKYTFTPGIYETAGHDQRYVTHIGRQLDKWPHKMG